MNCKNHPDREAVGACTYCGSLFCEECLVDVGGKKVCRDDVSKVFNEAKTTTPQISINNVNTNTNTAGFVYPQRSKWVAFFLCLFLGFLGAHRFYVGKSGTGILWLLTIGLFGFGIVLDLILILVGAFRDKMGMPLI